MTTARTRLFRTNKSQAVRLPKAVELPPSVNEVEIVAVGNARIITPAGESWDLWFDHSEATADFMEERDQPEDQQREAL